jgi:hypothetical protein
VNCHVLLAAGIDSSALPHDEEGPCAGHRGILFAFLFSFVLSICFSFSGIWGFLFFRLCFNFLSQESSIRALERVDDQDGKKLQGAKEKDN